MRLVLNSVVGFLAGATAACTAVHRGVVGVGAGRGSDLTSIDMNMPRAADLQAHNQEADALIQRRAFGYRLRVVPVDEGCTGATKIDQTGIFEATTRLASKIHQGCDYTLTLELGSLGSSGHVLERVLFRNDPSLKIAKMDILGKASFQTSLSLRDLSSNQAINVIPNTNPNNELQGQPSTPVLPGLPSDKDVEVTDANGAKVMLSSFFKGDYLLLDFSQPGCSACVSMAQELADDEDFRWAFTGASAKCSHATVVPSSQMSSWLRMFPVSGTVGAHSIFPSGGFAAVAGKLGRTITATPTFMLVDRSGKVIDSGEGNLPDSAFSVCGR